MSLSVSDDALIFKILCFQVEQEEPKYFPLIIGVFLKEEEDDAEG